MLTHTELVLLAVLLVTLVVAAVAIVAIVVHGRIADRAVERARQDDLPQILASSGNTLSNLLGAVRLRIRQLPQNELPGNTGTPNADSGAASATGNGGTTQ